MMPHTSMAKMKEMMRMERLLFFFSCPLPVGCSPPALVCGVAGRCVGTGGVAVGLWAVLDASVGVGGGVGLDSEATGVLGVAGVAVYGVEVCRMFAGRWQLGHISCSLKYTSPQLGHLVTLPAISTPQLGQMGALSLI